MSRSYKRVAIVKDRNDKTQKKLANKKVRRADVSNGSAYKKFHESWNISDWRCGRPYGNFDKSRANYPKTNTLQSIPFEQKKDFISK